MRQSILKKTAICEANSTKTSIDNKDLFNISSNNVSSPSLSKIVRFSGLDNDEVQNPVEEPLVNDGSDSLKNLQINEDIKSYEDETIDIRKYYRKSKSLPFRQINLIGLNGEFIVASNNQLISQQQSNSSFQRHQKNLQRSKSLRVNSAKNLFEFRSNRQNTCPTISKTTPIATQLKAPTPISSFKNSSSNIFEVQNQTYYYWPSTQRQSPSYLMQSIPRSPNGSSQTSRTSLKTVPGTSSQTSMLNNNAHVSYKSTGSSIPVLSSKYLNANLFLSSNLNSPSSPDKILNAETQNNNKIDSVSYSNIDHFSSQLLNSNLLPSRSNSSNGLTLYTYLVQSSNKNVKRDAKASILRAQIKKQSDSNAQSDYRAINNSNTQATRTNKFSSLANNFLNSSLTNNLNRNVNARRSVEPLLETSTLNLTAMDNNNNKNALNSLFLNNITASYVSPLRLRTNSANTISSTAIR